jgi:hypothetical protein
VRRLEPFRHSEGRGVGEDAGTLINTPAEINDD